MKNIPKVDHIVAISEDGIRFNLKNDGTWEPSITLVKAKGIRFRSSGWGDSPSQVLTAEASEPLQGNDEILLYESRVGGFPVKVMFNFVNGFLQTGMYRFEQTHSDPSGFMDDFDSLQSMLKSKYGRPQETQDFRQDHLVKYASEQYGLSTPRGDKTVFAKWRDGETSLGLLLTGDNNSIQLSAIYRSHRLEDLAKAEADRGQMEGH